MPASKKKPKPNGKSKNEKPVSLYPLKFEEALMIALNTKVVKEGKNNSKKK